MQKTFRQSRGYRVTIAILFGLACVWAGHGMYQDVTAYESRESGLALNILLMTVYDLVGKWGVLIASLRDLEKAQTRY